VLGQAPADNGPLRNVTADPMAVGSQREPQEQLPVTNQTQQPVSPWTDAAAFWLLGLLNNSGRWALASVPIGIATWSSCTETQAVQTHPYDALSDVVLQRT
jgi:hypothetical protein